jgi:hypothetical protein
MLFYKMLKPRKRQKVTKKKKIFENIFSSLGK